MQVLLLEDDIDLGQAVTEHLEAHGHEVQWVKRLAQAEAWMREHRADALLLDLSLPDGDALPALARWRAAGRREPALALTARAQVAERIAGLRAGADDYLVKPFDLDELIARLEAVRRRSGPAAPAPGIVLDAATRTARVGSRDVGFTAMEWAVLARLAQHPGRVYSRPEIESALADAGLSDAQSNSLEVIVSRLRKKLGAGAIHTLRGLGYRFDPAAGA